MERWSISPALDSRAPVITTLNLAGHSSTPLIEHLNLTRCYCWSQRFCQVLTNQWIVPDHHGTLPFFAAQPCMLQAASESRHTPARAVNVSAAWEIKNELEGYCKNQIIPHHLKDTTPEISLFPVMLCCGAILWNTVYISPVISDCYHASSDLVSVCDTGACPKGIYILILTR